MNVAVTEGSVRGSDAVHQGFGEEGSRAVRSQGGDVCAQAVEAEAGVKWLESLQQEVGNAAGQRCWWAYKSLLSRG